MNATEIANKAVETMAARGAERDQPSGERSMARTVKAFNILFDKDLTETEGWMFMVILKAARAATSPGNLDHYVDGAAYEALAGESATQEKTAKEPSSKPEAGGFFVWKTITNKTVNKTC